MKKTVNREVDFPDFPDSSEPLFVMNVVDTLLILMFAGFFASIVMRII